MFWSFWKWIRLCKLRDSWNSVLRCLLRLLLWKLLRTLLKSMIASSSLPWYTCKIRPFRLTWTTNRRSRLHMSHRTPPVFGHVAKLSTNIANSITLSLSFPWILDWLPFSRLAAFVIVVLWFAFVFALLLGFSLLIALIGLPFALAMAFALALILSTSIGLGSDVSSVAETKLDNFWWARSHRKISSLSSW